MEGVFKMTEAPRHTRIECIKKGVNNPDPKAYGDFLKLKAPRC